MIHARAVAIWVAVLFIIATVTSVVAAILMAPLDAAGDLAAAVSAAPGTVVSAVVLMFASAAAIIAIPAVFYPLLRRHSEAGALLYFAARIFESVAYLSGGVFTLALVGTASRGDDGAVMLALKDLGDMAFATGPTLFFSLGALVLAVLLYRSRLVPRWLSAWKFLGALLLLGQGVLILYDATTPMLEATLYLPIAVNEMVLAVWLIVRGFERDAVARLPA